MTGSQSTRQAVTDTELQTRPDGAAQVIGFSIRVAGRVPTRVDIQHAGTPEVQVGVSLGTVLAYLTSAYTAQKIANGWASAAVLASSLTPHLSSRRGVLTGGPWSVAAMVRVGVSPNITGGLIRGQAGSEVPSMLRLRVGPITWDLCDAAAYTSTLAAWKKAATLLAAVDELGGA